LSNVDDFQELTSKIRDFAVARDWEKFHTPKNLAMAIAGEAGELAAEFQWLTAEESMLSSLSDEQLRKVRLEIADVQIYLLRIADVLDIDLPKAVFEKMKINDARF
jgi:NTP pyrophosphatase (non-canonical NTP hydrolase)